MNRWKDWWDQAERDVRHAHHAVEDGDYEWSAFAALQAAEKAVKALIMNRGGEPWGHSTTELAEALPGDVAAPSDLRPRAVSTSITSRRVIPTGSRRATRGSSSRGEAEGAIADAEKILEFCRRRLP